MTEKRAWRGYLICHCPFNNTWRVEKDGYHIGWAASEAECKTIIALLTFE